MKPDPFPTTEAGRALYEALVDLGIAHAVNGSAGIAILAIEAEARAAAPPDIDVRSRLIAGLPQILSDIDDAGSGEDDWTGSEYVERLADGILRHLASPDATRREPPPPDPDLLRPFTDEAP